MRARCRIDPAVSETMLSTWGGVARYTNMRSAALRCASCPSLRCHCCRLLQCPLRVPAPLIPKSPGCAPVLGASPHLMFVSLPVPLAA